jgi:uncharacterized protein YigE (DUF2233 family)
MRLALILLVLLLPQVAGAVTCGDLTFEGASYTVCDMAATEDVRLFQSGPDGAYGSFAAVDKALAAQGQRLLAAMNGGMYHHDLAPVGLYVEAGAEAAPLITRDGPGNFGLLPNGVFCIAEVFSVVESRAFEASGRRCRYATQSGPMLVIDGALHPKFLPTSDSLYVRNGVGVSADGSRAAMVISNDAVNFHSFARLFRDRLGLPNALYLDGNISRLYAPDLRRHDGGFPMGPILGVVGPQG